MGKSFRVLVIEDSEDDTLLVIRALQKGGYDPIYERVETAEAMRKALERGSWDVILCDYQLPQFKGLAAIAVLKETGIDIPLIIVSGAIGEEMAAECMRSGAHDYVMKGHLSRLVPVIQRELREAESRRERKRAEEALQASETRYRRLFESARDGILILDADTGQIIDANPFMQDLLGYSCEEFVGKTLWDIGSFKDIAASKSSFDEWQRKGYVRYEDLPIETSDGRYINVEFVSNVYMVDSKSIIQCNIRDITERKHTEELLRDSEQKYRKIFENAAEGIFQGTPEGRYISVNPAFARIGGYDSPDEMINAVTDIQRQMYVYQDDRMRLIELLKNQAVVNNFEAEVRRRDGSTIWISMNVSSVKDKSGKIVLLEGAIVDITERKRAEEALQMSETRYRRLFEKAQDGILILNAETGQIDDVNPYMIDMLHYSHDEFMGMKFWEVSPFKNTVLNLAAFEELQDKGYIRYKDLPLETKEGKPIAVEFVSNVYKANGNKVIQCNIRNITENKEAKQKLQEAVIFQQRLIDALPVPVFYKDLEGRYLGCNSSFEKFFGKKREQVTGKSVYELSPKEFADIYHEKDLALLQNPGIQIYESKIKDAGGVAHNVIFHNATFPNMDGSVGGLIGAIIDITERKQAEEEVKQYSAELVEKNEELRAMTQQLWQAAKLATMGELSASIAHELNNPLATVSLRVESLLEKTPEDNSNRRELKIIEQEVERMSNLIANLLQFSRRSQQQISTVDICDEIEKTLELVYYHLRKHNIVIRREFAKEAPRIHADRQQMRQMLLNLFTNASDAMAKGGTLTIRVIAPPESTQVIMEIADTGTGIPPEILPKVAEPFYTTKPEGEGTGLGLAICRRIVHEHNGTFDLASEGIPGKGTTAHISLPVTNRYGFSQPEKSMTEVNVRSKG